MQGRKEEPGSSQACGLFERMLPINHTAWLSVISDSSDNRYSGALIPITSVARFRAQELDLGVFPRTYSPLKPWPRATCREQRDAILLVSETTMCLNARSLWQGHLVAALGAVVVEVDFWSPVTWTKLAEK